MVCTLLQSGTTTVVFNLAPKEIYFKVRIIDVVHVKYYGTYTESGGESIFGGRAEAGFCFQVKISGQGTIPVE